jgi:hypothetical protein
MALKGKVQKSEKGKLLEWFGGSVKATSAQSPPHKEFSNFAMSRLALNFARGYKRTWLT